MLSSTEAVTILPHVFDYKKVTLSMIESCHLSEGLGNLECRAVTNFR